MPKKSKDSKGKRSHSRGKGKKKSKKGKKGSKKKQSKLTSVTPDVPEPDVFFWVRRKNISLYVEATDELTVKELKLMVATIYGYFPEDIALFHNSEEMLEKKTLKKKSEDKSKGSSKASVKSGSSSGRGSSKDKRGSKGKDKRRRSNTSKHEAENKEKDNPIVQIFTIGNYDFNARTSPLFNPSTIGLVFRDKNGNFEPLEIVPWTKPVEIPESVKPYLRNYNVEPVVTAGEEELEGDLPRVPLGKNAVKAKKPST